MKSRRKMSKLIAGILSLILMATTMVGGATATFAAPSSTTKIRVYYVDENYKNLATGAEYVDYTVNKNHTYNLMDSKYAKEFDGFTIDHYEDSNKNTLSNNSVWVGGNRVNVYFVYKANTVNNQATGGVTFYDYTINPNNTEEGLSNSINNNNNFKNTYDGKNRFYIGCAWSNYWSLQQKGWTGYVDGKGLDVNGYQNGNITPGIIRGLSTDLSTVNFALDAADVFSTKSVPGKTVYSDYSLLFDTEKVDGATKYTLNSVLKPNGSLATKAGNDFFPLNEYNYQDAGNGNDNNYFFGMRYDVNFTLGDYTPNAAKDNLTYSFTGDDDLWVFLDGKLVLDIGGIHDAIQNSVNLWTTGPIADEIKEYGTASGTKNHTITVLYMERGAGASNCNMNFIIPNATVNKASTGTINFQKTDSSTNEGLGGAAFVLTGNDYNQTAVSDNVGNVSFAGLKDGNYTLTEQSSPVGYTKTDEVYNVSVSTNSSTKYVTSVLTDSKGKVVSTVVTGEYGNVINDSSSAGKISNAPKKSEDNFYTVKSLGGQVDATNDQWWVNFDFGGTATETTKKPMDVVLLIDKSGSMGNTVSVDGKNVSRWDALKEAVTDQNGLVDNILSANPSNRISMIFFSEDNDKNTVSKEFSNDSATVKGFFANQGPDSSTYISRGISAVDNMLDKANKDANKVVIVLTDGVPGYYASRSGNETSYPEAVKATTAMNTLKNSHKAALIYTVSYAMNEIDGTTIINSEYVGSTGKDKNYGLTCNSYGTKYYVKDSVFAPAFLLSLASNSNNCYKAGVDNISAILSDLYDDIEQTQKTASNVVITDEVADKYFKYVGDSTTATVQYRANAKSEWVDLTTTPNANGYYYTITKEKGEGEGGTIEFHVGYVHDEEASVRFKLQLNEGVYSQNNAGTPDLPTNDVASVTYKDVNGTDKSYTSTNPSGYGVGTNLNTPYVYVPNNNPTIGNVVTDKTSTVLNWDDRTYTIDLYAGHNLKVSNTTNIAFALDISGSMPWFVTQPMGGVIKKSNLPTSNRETLTSNGSTGIDAWDYTYYVKREGEYKPIAWNGSEWRFIKSSSDGSKIFESKDTGKVTDNENIYVRGAKDQTKLEALQESITKFVQNMRTLSPDTMVGFTFFAGSLKNGSNNLHTMKKVSEITDDDLTSMFANVTLYGGTNQAAGLDDAKNMVSSVNNSNTRNIILFSDGAETINNNPGSAEDYSNIVKNSGITLYTAGLFANLDDGGCINLRDWASADCGFSSNTSVGLVNSFNTIFAKINANISNAMVTDYIDNRFELLNEDGVIAKAGDVVNGGTVKYDENKKMFYIEWTNQTLGYVDNVRNGWYQTITVKAKDNYIGGNNVTTNGADSGVSVGDDKKTFPQPTVNVKTIAQIQDANEVIFSGDKAADLAGIIKGMVNVNTSLVGNNGATVVTDDFSFEIYSDEACTKKVNNIAEAVRNADVTYYVKAAYKNVGSATDQSNANTAGNVATGVATHVSDNTKTNATYQLDVVKGEIDLTKIINAQYTPISAVKANETFVFKIVQYSVNADGTKGSNVLKTFYATVSFDANGNATSGTEKICGLDKGYYTVTEESTWTPKYDLTGTADNYTKNNTEAVDIFVGEKTNDVSVTYNHQNVRPNFFGLETFTTKVGNVQKYTAIAGGNEATVTFNNTLSTDWKWFSDVASATNKFVK